MRGFQEKSVSYICACCFLWVFDLTQQIIPKQWGARIAEENDITQGTNIKPGATFGFGKHLKGYQSNGSLNQQYLVWLVGLAGWVNPSDFTGSFDWDLT